MSAAASAAVDTPRRSPARVRSCGTMLPPLRCHWRGPPGRSWLGSIAGRRCETARSGALLHCNSRSAMGDLENAVADLFRQHDLSVGGDVQERLAVAEPAGGGGGD